MELSEIIPTRASFELSLTGKKHYLRPINLRDEIWLENTFKGDMANILEDVRLLTRAVYNQIEDKTPFKKQTVTFIDEEGNEAREERGGYDLFLSLVSGVQEKLNIMQAWLETIGISRPAQEELKKKII